MKPRLRILLGLLLFAWLVPFFPATPAHAMDALQGRRATLALDPLDPIMTGSHPILTLHLSAEYGQPIANQPIIIFVDGHRKAAGKTDSRGIATIALKYKFPAGTYNVLAVYPGIPSIGVNRATAQTEMTILPARVAISTVPPLPGVRFKLGNQIYTTGKDGAVQLEVGLSGIYTLEVLPIDDKVLASNVRAEFTRWNDNVFTVTRQVYFPRSRPLEAGFTLRYEVDQEFYDSSGDPVDPARVAAMTLRSAGETYTFDQAGPIWLDANRLTRRVGEHLETEDRVYYLRDVRIDGASVINKSEQRFNIRPDDVWPIQVLLYSARFTASDAMFHFAVGQGVELTYPDGRKKQFLFDSPNREIVIPSLARGSYTARIIGAVGSAPPTPIHLSRDQEVELLLLSVLDLAVIFGTPLVIAVAFFFIGRPRWFRILIQPSKYRELISPRS